MRRRLCVEIHCFYNPDNEGLCAAGLVFREFGGENRRYSVVGKVLKLDGTVSGGNSNG
jgi:hypothetical protein